MKRSSPQDVAGLAITEARAREILNERIKVIYRYQPVLLVINAVVGAAMIYGLWQAAPGAALLAWGVAAIAALALRAGFYAAYRRAPAPEERLRVWAGGAVVCSAASGALWGAAGAFLFPPDSLEYQLFILFILMGMGAGAVSSLTTYMPAFYAFLPVSLIPIGVRLLFEAEPIHTALGVMTFAYLGGLSFFASTINRTIGESLRLRFQNLDLVRELSAQRDEAERANVSKSRFLAAASHDLRQPLHALTLFTSALDERITYPEVRRIVDHINVSVGALEKLFNALLDISRLDAGVMQPEQRHFRLDELLARLVNDHAPEAEHKRLRLACAPCELVVYSDPALLERILRNYVANAIRYTERGEVRIELEPAPPHVRIVVADTGVGIPASQHREIFKEFHQLGNPERDRTKGLGLGLAIVERIARLLHHPIAVESAPGKGARFSVTVPLGDPSRVVSDAPPATETRADLTGLCVLVIDDERATREGMRTLLEQWGCRVLAAGSEEEAASAVRAAAAAPQAIVVDYRLREERTGVQAIGRMRAEFGSTIPALIVTGDTAPERLREAKASGYPLVHKPVQPAVLRTFLRNARQVRRAS
ncbi:MAG TPA: hybrid sensor histidine kinase/response regulator [Burkholderiales bacterium]